MDALLSRYRNISVLLLVIFAQLVLLGYQVKSEKDVRVLRVWAVTAVTPVARVIEGARSATVGVFENYFVLRDLREQNRRMQEDLGKLKLENQFLKGELATADRAKALTAFQSRTLSKTLAARIFGMGGGTNARVLFADRGSLSGVQKGMAVITPDGIVGKVLAAFPTTSQVMLVTDPDFGAGVVSQKTRVRGTLKGQGYAACRVDYIPNEEKVEVGEMFYTSGDDRVFPRGFPAAVVRVVRPGNPFKEVLVEPTGMQHGGVEEVLILLEGMHQEVPEPQQASQQVYLAPAPPPQAGELPGVPQVSGAATEADRLRERYKAIGDAQNHKFGEGPPGSRPPNFNLAPGATPPPGAAPAPKPVAGAPTQAVAPRPPGQPVPGEAKPMAGAPGTTPQSKPTAGAPPPPKPTGQPAGGQAKPIGAVPSPTPPAKPADEASQVAKPAGQPATGEVKPTRRPATAPAPKPDTPETPPPGPKPAGPTP